MSSSSSSLSSNVSSSPPQECPSTHDLVNSLRQVEKMLAVHEASYQQGLRSLRKKISALHNSTMAIFKTGGEKRNTSTLILLQTQVLFLSSCCNVRTVTVSSQIINHQIINHQCDLSD